MKTMIYQFTVMLVRLYARLMLKFDVSWLAQLPDGAKLLAANHPSATDPVVIHLLLREQLGVLVTGKAFDMPLAGKFLRLVGQIPVVAEHGKESLEEGVNRLKAGRAVGIFPEGWISPESGYNPAHTGAARIALETGAPVIPIGIYLQRNRRTLVSSTLSGKYTAALWYFRGPYFVTVGEPIKFSGDVEDKALVQKVTAQIMERIDELAKESERRALKK